MAAIRVLFLNPEQYVDFESEPSNVQCRLPILHCGRPMEGFDHVYQRDLRPGGGAAMVPSGGGAMDPSRGAAMDRSGRAAMDRGVLDAAAEVRADLVVYSATWEHENVSPWVLRSLRDRGIPVVAMLWDSWTEPTAAEVELLAASTVLVVGDSLHTYLRCRALARHLTPAPAVVWSGGQVFTEVIRPLPDETQVHDVTLLGSLEGERVRLAAALAAELPKHGIRLHKAGGLVDSRRGTTGLTDDWVSWPEYVRIINRSRICLNSQTDPNRQQIKGKIFDYLAAGAFCLTETNAETDQFFPGGTVATFTTPDECVERIRQFLADDAARRRVAEAGHTWFRATFDYKVFWSGVLARAMGETAACPRLPVLESAFDRLTAVEATQLRRRATQAAMLARTAFAAPPAPRRLAAAWLGRSAGFHLLALETGCFAAVTRMPVDFAAVGDAVCVATGSGEFQPLIIDRMHTLADGARAAVAGTEAWLRALIDRDREDAPVALRPS